MDEIEREFLSPRAKEVLGTLYSIRDEGAALDVAVNNAREESTSPDGTIWACADGQGFIRALVIDDEAIRDYSAEELEDLISDVMIEASGRGQAVGEELVKDFVPENFANLV
ncbi:hypothetical protein [Mycolicibacterium lutetiense]